MTETMKSVNELLSTPLPAGYFIVFFLLDFVWKTLVDTDVNDLKTDRKVRDMVRK